MGFAKFARPLMASIGISGLIWLGGAGAATLARPPIQPAVDSGPRTVTDLSEKVWASAQGGKGEAALSLLRSLPATGNSPSLDRLRAANALLDTNIQKREAARAKKIAEVNKTLDDTLAAPVTNGTLSKALKSAVELYMLSVDKPATLKEPKIAKLIDDAATAAKKAENSGDWIMASELFFRLNALLEEQGTFKKDVERLSDRLAMIHLYVPARFYELRKAQAALQGDDAPPAYNALGENFAQKLAGINEEMVGRALARAAQQQVDRTPKTMGMVLNGGLDAIRTMMTTPDLERAFPGITDTDSRTKMLDFLDNQEAQFSAPDAKPGPVALGNLLDELLETNRATVKVPDAAILHEFGNGAMSKLDEFSAIIWPDEKARFDRMTQGEFRGVGVQITPDKETQSIKIVTPLDNTPAQRAGVHAGDIITKIDGQPARGLTLNQAIDLITGPVGTKVTITVDRAGKEIDFSLPRAVIPLITVKGWKRLGPEEDQWDWFIDPEDQIGYIRLLQFTENTTRDMSAAIKEMQKTGLKGLILDLRFNPGGLLTQAESVANAFINKGLIVSTQGNMPSEMHYAKPQYQLVDNIPIAVLVNEGSASASEIVSGAIRHYADHKEIRAIVVGARSFGKGSVQNVWGLNAEQTALMKLTTQYYHLPDGRVLHRRPGATVWGVEPHVAVEMLPEQITDSLKLRMDADVVAIDETGQIVKNAPPPPDPKKLIDDGLDLQLQTALVLLQSQAITQGMEHVRLP